MHLLDKDQNYSNIDYGLVDFNHFWNELCDKISLVFKLDSETHEWLKGKEVAKLIAAIPFLAGCIKPKQTSTAHLSIYLLSVLEPTKTIFHHEEWNDDIDIMNRLSPISDFNGGNDRIIERGMNLLALNMICGYERDVQKDRVIKKYNPLISKIWDCSNCKNELLAKINNYPCPEMDEIFNMDIGILSFWGRD